jgi:hypothetical protein
MKPTTSEIERVVREVLAELQRAPGRRDSPPAASPPVSASRPLSAEPHSSPDPDGALVLNQRVVTMNDVSDRLAGKRRVRVRPGTVITPAVRDELHQRNVRLEFVPPKGRHFGDLLRLIFVAIQTRMDPKPLIAALRCEGIEATWNEMECVITATDYLAGELAKSDTLGVLLTPHTAAALCLANRLPGVRAILGSEAKGLPEDAAAVGANVVIVNPEKHSPYQLQQLIEKFYRGGVQRCPEVFFKRLS